MRTNTFAKSASCAAFALAAALVPAGLAHAADTDDPYAAGCTAGAYAVAAASADSPIGEIHLMYSPHCATNWAEADGTPATEIEIYVWNAYGQHEQESYYGTASYGWTDMVSGVPAAGVCISDAVDVYCYAQSGAGNPPTSPAL